MLTAAEIVLIRRQNNAISLLGYAFGAECLARACWAHPWLRDHLPRDVHELRGRITPAIDEVVSGLDHPGRLEATVAGMLAEAGLGQVPARVIDVLAEALIATLRSRLEEDFTAAAEAAWRHLLADLFPVLGKPETLSQAA